MPRYIPLIVALGVMLAMTMSASAAERAHEYKLDNGLLLIVQEDHRAPVAVVQIWYKVGSSYEHDGITGLSHALEHMMFKATSSLKTGELSQLIAARGGKENAFTTTDYTAYYQQWAKENVELSFKLEADRMHNLRFDPQEFSQEIRVILEERRLRTEDDPQALALEVAQSVAFQTSPYRQPIIGWSADIEQMPLADLKAWYRRWYAPNNAIVVVVGDVVPMHVRDLAQRYFGPLPAQTIAPVPPRPEVPQLGTKRVTMKSDKAQLPYLMMSYKAPALTAINDPAQKVADWEPYALEVLAQTLDGNASARLSRNLVRGQGIAAASAASYSAASLLETLFSISAVPTPEHTLAQLEQALLEQIAALQTQAPSLDELARIKTEVVASAVYAQDSMFGQASLIGSLAAIGLDWRTKDHYVERIKAVTPAQVQAVAQKYLIPEGLTIAYLLPKDGK